uniref:Polyprotein n=1 Tax=Cajanus cajan TaxID=3821 RepID=A0A151TCZ8_CAJCA|nr:polyprotein [Cajanus cajan]
MRTPNTQEGNPSTSQDNSQTEIQIAEIENSLHNWSIPIIKKCEVYKQHSIFSTNQDEIHISEFCYPGTKTNKIINILQQDILDEHIKKGYNFMHLGLIQVAAKPNYRLGVNSPILLLLRDIRMKQFQDSIIAILESNLHDGPAFFNCYPNFSMNIRNSKTSNALKLYVIIPDEILDEDSGPIQLIFRIYYKVTKIDYNYKALRSSPKNEIVLVEANLRKSSIQVPRRLSHAEVISKIPIPEDWLLENIIDEPKIYNTHVREIVQEGTDIRLRMNRSKSFRTNLPQMIYKGNSARHSVDGSTINIDLTKLDIKSKITRPVYENVQHEEEVDDFNPTASQIINTIIREEPFQIDKEWINQDFKADYNKELRKWYFANFTQEETIKFRNLYYSYMEENEINIYFFDWLKDYCKENNIIKSINPLVKTNKMWKTIDNKIIISEYPPMTTVKIEIEKQEIEARNSDKATALIIVQGFTGQLKGWWDNFWTPADKESILNAVKPETGEEDAVATLIYTIIQHFIGDPNTFKDRAASQLANLYCPTMSDYCWYRDIFMSKITL